MFLDPSSKDGKNCEYNLSNLLFRGFETLLSDMFKTLFVHTGKRSEP